MTLRAKMILVYGYNTTVFYATYCLILSEESGFVYKMLVVTMVYV